tara:strand:- start:3719 stop:4765 length:1047 start_codon:yes stop_codon:yes gene_type:complete
LKSITRLPINNHTVRKYAIAALTATIALSQTAPAFAAPALSTAERAELASVQSTSQTVWSSTSPWSERQADLRDAMWAGKSVTPGVWTKGLASRVLRSSSTPGGYNQKTYGVVGGIDFGSRSVFAENDAVIYGATLGYIDSNVDFDNSADKADYTGLVAGLYATYIRNGFYVDTSLKFNQLEMEYTGTTFVTFTVKPDVQTIGGQIDIGNRYDLGRNYFVEPLASLSYAETSTDSVTAIGVGINFEDAKSLKSSVGVRFGRVLNKSEDAIVTASLTGKVWNEFMGENKTNFALGAAQSKDDFGGAYGDVGGNIEVTGMNGLSGFVSTGIKFKDNYTETGIRVGMRLNF